METKELTVAELVSHIRDDNPDMEQAKAAIVGHKSRYPYEWIAEQLDLWKNSGDLDAYTKFTEYHDTLRTLEDKLTAVRTHHRVPSKLEILSEFIHVGADVIGVELEENSILSTVVTKENGKVKLGTSVRKRRSAAPTPEPRNNEYPVVTVDDFVGFDYDEFLGQRFLFARTYRDEKLGPSIPLMGWIQNMASISGMYTTETINSMRADDLFREELMRLPTNLVYRIAYGLISGVFGKLHRPEYYPDSVAICDHEVGFRNFKVCRLVTRCTENDGCVWILTEGKNGIAKQVSMYPTPPAHLNNLESVEFQEFVKTHHSGFGTSGCKGTPYMPPRFV